MTAIGLAGSAARRSPAPSVVLSKLSPSREGRENRPQLRCGNASQTRTTPDFVRGGQSQSEHPLRRRRGRGQLTDARSRFGRGSGVRSQASDCDALRRSTCASVIICGVRTSAPKVSRVGVLSHGRTSFTFNFIAKMKRESGASASGRGYCSCRQDRYP